MSRDMSTLRWLSSLPLEGTTILLTGSGNSRNTKEGRNDTGMGKGIYNCLFVCLPKYLTQRCTHHCTGHLIWHKSLATGPFKL